MRARGAREPIHSWGELERAPHRRVGLDSVTRDIYRRLPGCVVMGINRTRRLFGRQKRTRGPQANTLCVVFRPRCYHFLSLSFCFFILWSRKLRFRYAHRYFLDIYDTLEQSKELSRRGFRLDDRCLKRTIGLLYCSILPLLLKKFTHFFLS